MAEWLLKIFTTLMNPLLTVVLTAILAIAMPLVCGALVLSFNFANTINTIMLSSAIANNLYKAFEKIGLAFLGLSILIFVFKAITRYIDNDTLDIFKVSKHIVTSIFAFFLLRPLTLFAYYFCIWMADALQNNLFSFADLSFSLFTNASSGLSQAIGILTFIPTQAMLIVEILVIAMLVYVVLMSIKITVQMGIRSLSIIVCIIGGYFSVCYFALGNTDVLKKYTSQVLHLSITHIIQTMLYFLAVYLMMGNMSDLDILSAWFFAMCSMYLASNLSSIISAIGFDGSDPSRGAMATLMTTAKVTAGLAFGYSKLISSGGGSSEK